jgi:hypothetical protein
VGKTRQEPEDIPEVLSPAELRWARLRLANDMLHLIQQDSLPRRSETATRLAVALALLGDLRDSMERERLIPRRVRS